MEVFVTDQPVHPEEPAEGAPDPDEPGSDRPTSPTPGGPSTGEEPAELALPV